VNQSQKLELALWAKDTLVPVLRAKGDHHPAGAEGPTRWRLATPGLRLVYTEGALLSPDDRSLSCLLDFWAEKHKKVVALSWEEARPWHPIRIVRLVKGPWLADLRRLAVEEA
jgi:hypothetical protein